MKKFLFLILIIFQFVFYGAEILKAQIEKSTIAGTVTEEKSGEVVIGITVSIYEKEPDTKTKPLRGAYTNNYGFYSIPEIAPGDYTLTVRGVGYLTFKKKITILENKDQIIDINLILKDIRTQEVTVEADRNASPTRNISSVDIDPSFVQKMPSLGGETDVFRTLQLLPGVQQASELSSGLYVRGASPDQNLTLLDGAIVYNPSHLGGFLSTFNADALRDIRLIKGAFPAEYGGRLSSFLDMTMKEGTKEKISGAGGISTISSRLTIEGPIGEDVTFMLSGRRMYLDILTDIVFPDDDVPGYYFYDVNAKINYKISSNDRIYLSGFFGRDVLLAPERERENFDISWGNKTGSFRWKHIVSPKLFTNLSLILTDYNFSSLLKDDQSNNSLEIFSGINDVMLKMEAQYFPFENHIIKSGIEATWHTFKAYARSEIFEENNFQPPLEEIKTLDAALFIQDEWKITDMLSTNLGGRLYYFQEGNYLNFEPRLSANYILSDIFSLNAAISLVHQYLHLLVRNDIALPTDLWFPSTESTKPSKSWQGVLGAEAILGDGEYQLTAEVYYKDMQNIYEYMDGADFNFGVPIEEQFVSGRGESYGLEVFLNKRIGSFTGWIGYTLAWSKRYFDDLNNGKPFYPRYDRRHDISIVLSYEINKIWEFSAVWVYGTGQAFTMPTGVYSLPDIGQSNQYGDWYYEKYQFTERNGFRLPAYHRMDLNIMYNYKWFDIPFQFSLNIYNLYNHRNPFAWYIGYDYDRNSYESKKVMKQITLFPIIPTIGISFKF